MKQKEDMMHIPTTTQPAMADTAKTRVLQFFEAVRLIAMTPLRVRQRWQNGPVDEMDREQLIDQLIREGHLHCHGSDNCTGCQAFIKDVIGD